MTPHGMRGRRPPHWWPENEPWPPVGRGPQWGRGRARFVRRAAGLFAVLLTLSAIGLTTLLSLLVARHGGASLSTQAAVSAFVVLMPLLVLLIFRGGMRRVGSPLGDIVAAADRVANGDFSARIEERGPPFLRSIAHAFNNMTVRLKAQDQQRRDLMADIAHELRTPLSVIQGRLEGLLDGVYPRDDEQLTEVVEETRMLARLVEDLRTLANAEAGSLSLRKEPTDLAVLLHDAAATLAADARTKDVEVRVEERAELPLVDVDPLRVREVVINLLANAIRHTGRGGTITVTSDTHDGRIVVSVADTGAGIPPEELPRIFDRFYKGRASHGSGLGLTIARNLIAAHGGDIRAESRVGHGTTITFTLPLSAEDGASAGDASGA
jgi:signal transduction histidine kinase